MERYFPKKELPRLLVGCVLYLLISSFWLMAQGVTVTRALPLAFVSGVIMTAAAAIAVTFWLRSGSDRKESDFNPAPSRRLVSGGREPVGNNGKNQESFRRERRIGALRREAARMHDRIFSMGATISVALVLFWIVMRVAFDASPQDTYFIPWYALALTWFFLIVLLPAWLTYSTLLGMAGLRFALEVFGPTILILLPNFLMLPFFYLFMMFFMFGSMMIPNIMQFKFYKPGDATWETPKGTMRGQSDARATVETEIRKFVAWAEGKSNRKATRGMIFEGPPGTGKTLYAKELGTELEIPFVFADGQAFNAPFMGFAPLLVMYLRWRTEGLAREYGGAIVFIDEAEQLLQVRSGMQTGGQFSGSAVNEVWDLLPFDSAGRISPCGLLFDIPATSERFWTLKDHGNSARQRVEPRQYAQPMFFGGMGGGMGANAAIFPFLTWLNGADGPPMLQKIMRGKVNDLLNAFFVPVTIRGRTLRLPPGKPQDFNLLFLAATNRAWMIDPAMRRPGRFGVKVLFKIPDIEARKDIAELYFRKSAKNEWLHPDLLHDERIEEFSRATPGMSPAEIEAIITNAVDVRIQHVENLNRIKELIDSGVAEENLLEQDRKYWLRYKEDVARPGWNDMRADWASLMESRSQTVWGRAEPGITSPAHKIRTAYHELMGHFIELKAFLGEHMRPTVLTIMPRGSALGMVAHVPVEERDPMPQAFYEGMIRVSVGSTIAERFFFNENQPGVGRDLENATAIACFMVGKCAMMPYACLEKDRRRYLDIGETLISVIESSPANPMAQSFVEKVLMSHKMRERVAIFLGQAAVDDYRLVKSNAHLAQEIVDELLKTDELAGQKLEDLWSRLDRDLVTFTDPRMLEENLTSWPNRHFAPGNPFYATRNPEAEEARS